ncbi:UNVERIFIED_CONTAM: hypothetical protein GTU68_009104 [Idotea baltica]|nr:hypothetical protein [Idotea baltica]
MDVLSPLDGQVLTTIAKGTTADMESAIASARAAFDDRLWAGQPSAARKKVLLKWADLIESNALELAVLGVRDNGTEIGMAIKAEPGSAAGTIRYYAEALDKVYGEIAPTQSDVLGLIHKEPVGVVGAIIPWNFPLMIGAWKLGPALAMGNSVVLKPAETASLSLMRMVELAHEAGLPPGVLNAVTGEGAVVGEAMGLSMDVDVLVFTGSGGTGRRLMEYSARSNMKRVYLELGGKSPNIIFADAPDLDEAAKVAAHGIFRNAGQVCVAGSRLLVEASIHDEFVTNVAEVAKGMQVGHPLDPKTEIGPLVTEEHFNKVTSYFDIAREDGATVAAGGTTLGDEGYFIRPTLFTNANNQMRIAQEEIFGPVLTSIPFATEDEALSIANDIPYGLTGYVWTNDLTRALRFTDRLEAGMIWVNSENVRHLPTPFGGIKASGIGRDGGDWSFEFYMEQKHIGFATGQHKITKLGAL